MYSDLISIIIPVYNVFHYLNRCVDSMLRQSYSNLEIILVDDGSTDGSDTLCDQLGKKDRRVRVIHKSNSGPADTRNVGLDLVSGEYIVFVDSDDYVSADMVQKLYSSLVINDADMSICNCFYVDENGIPIPDRNQDLPVRDEVCSGLDIINRFSEPKGERLQTAVGKLYRKDLFTQLKFPSHKLCEDTFIAHRILGICNTVACISSADYYYVQHSGSIMHSKSFTYYLHEAEAYLDQATYSYEHKLPVCAGNGYWKAAIAIVNAFPFLLNVDSIQKIEYEDLLYQFRQNIKMRKYCTPKQKLQAVSVLLSPKIYLFVFRNPLRIQMKEFLSSTKDGGGAFDA